MMITKLAEWDILKQVGDRVCTALDIIPTLDVYVALQRGLETSSMSGFPAANT
jgi:hypothetical protein